MRTQSADTSLEIELFQIAGLRAFSAAKKFASARNISAWMHYLALQGQGENLSDYERALSFMKHSDLAPFVDTFRASVLVSSEWVLHPFDLLPPLASVSSALDQAQVRYALAGALARALYGFPRGVRSVDLLVDMDAHQVTAFVQALSREQIVPATDWSVEGSQQPLSLLHVPSLVSVNLFFPSKPPFDAAIFTRTRLLTLDQQPLHVPVIAPEDSVLQGIVQYHATGARDDDLYNDILGVLKVQAPTLDQSALAAAADALRVQVVLASLLEDAGYSL
jgi:hypothetical protein